LQKSTKLAELKMAMTVLSKAVKNEKNEAAPRLAVRFLPNITHPFASAKSAMHQIAKKTITADDRI